MSYTVAYEDLNPTTRGRARSQISGGRNAVMSDSQLQAQVDRAMASWADEVIDELHKYPAILNDFNADITTRKVRGNVFEAGVMEKFRTLRPDFRVSEEYVRTGNLAGAWQRRIGDSHGSRVVEFMNSVRDKWGRFYAGYVQGSVQTGFHAKHGWRTVQEVTYARRDDFKERVQDAINRALGV